MRRLSGVFLTLVLCGCASGGGTIPAAPKALPLDGLQGMDGGRIDVDAALRRGEHVALVFWQTWCTSCKAEAALIAQAHRDHGGAIRFVGVVPGRDATVDDEKVRETATRWGYTFPQVRDRDLSLSRGLGVSGTPTIVVLGADRRVLYDAHRAPEDWTRLEGAPAERGPEAGGCEDGVCPLPDSP